MCLKILVILNLLFLTSIKTLEAKSTCVPKKLTKTAELAFKRCSKSSTKGCEHLGLIYFARCELKKAKKIFIGGCKKGRKASCHNLATLYTDLNNQKKAIYFYKKAISLGNTTSFANLGSIYKKRGDMKEALSLYTKGCDSGHLLACAELSAEYFYEKKYDLSKELSKKACEGVELEEGRSDIIDRKKDAFKGSSLGCVIQTANLQKESKIRNPENVYNKMCNLKDEHTCYSIGYLYSQEFKDSKRAAYYYGKSCKLGSMKGCVQVASEKKDKKRLKKYCLDGFMDSCTALGIIHHESKKTKLAKKYLSRSCKAKDPSACTFIGLIEFKKKSYKGAKNYFTKSCKLGSKLSCYLSWECEYALGNKKNAQRMFKKYCDEGLTKACERVR